MPGAVAAFRKRRKQSTKTVMKTILRRVPGLLSACLVLSLVPFQPTRADSAKVLEINPVTSGQVLQEIIGQAISSPTGGTLFGYYTFIKGLDTLFTTTPGNEATALFTFFRDTSNVRVTANGPLLVLSREGTTTVYFNSSPSGDFSNPNSFRAGTPIQMASLRFQAVIDTTTDTALVTIEDTITSTSAFSLNGTKYTLGKVGDVLRTTQNVHLNTPGSLPSAWFGGYAIGAGKSEDRQ
jgi:hypothetical protein